MRQLDPTLDNLQTAKQRSPAWKVEIYDFNSTKGNTVPDNISRLVQGAELDPISGPLDITERVVSIQFTERFSDVAQGVTQGNSIGLTIADKGLVLDPVRGSDNRWLKQGNVVRLYEGDTGVPEEDWELTFTGTLVGRAGATQIDRGGNTTLQVTAEDRMASLLKVKTTSRDFGQGTQYQSIMRSILEDELGLADSEFELANIGQQITTQSSTQIVDESPMLSMAKFSFLDGFVPRWRGDGVLIFSPNFSTQGAAVVYENLDLFEGFARPASPLETTNEVEVVGLESTLTEIPQPTQELASAGVTLGFFGGDASIKVAWSDDETQQARNVRLNIVSSVTGALIPFGAESFTPLIDDDGGSRKGVIDVEGAFYAPLITTLYAAAIAAQFIPDKVVTFGVTASTGVTIPVGRLLEMSASIAIATIQATIGRGDYQILGEPYEYVFQEILGVARVGEFAFVDIRGIRVENHLIDSQVEADTIALRELRTIRKKGNLWQTVMRHDMRLEPGDKFLLPSEEEYIILEVSRVISREENQTASMSIYETTFGVNP